MRKNIVTCEVEGCNVTNAMVNGKSGKHRMNLCPKHKHQMDRYGAIQSRTMHDPNEIVICDGYAEIIIYNKQQQERCRALIDIEDIPLVSQYRWSIDGRGYVCTHKSPYTLHRLVMGNPKGFEVDHIFHNLLDNRKSKLRVATRSQNNMNHGLSSHNTSGYKGISYRKNTGTWEAYIHQYGKKVSLGDYKDIEDAIAKRTEAEKVYFGDYADKRGVAV